MPFESDRTPRTDSAQARIQASNAPNTGVKEGDFAFLVQRADVPKDFKGLIDSVYELGSVALKPYLDPVISRLDELEFAVTFEEADPIATEQVAELQAELEALKSQMTELKAKLEDKELPRMVLLDEIEDIARGGLHDISMRVYVDD